MSDSSVSPSLSLSVLCRKPVALKRRFFPELGQHKDFFHELKLLQRVEHPNLIKCFGGFFGDDGSSFYLALEYAEYGDLYQKLQSSKRAGRLLDEALVWRICTQVQFNPDLKWCGEYALRHGILITGLILCELSDSFCSQLYPQPCYCTQGFEELECARNGLAQSIPSQRD